MDSRGIPIVVPGTPRRTPKNTPTRHEHHTSPFIINSLRNEKSLLEVYDSFADACFQSHFNHSMLNEDFRYNIHNFYKTEMCPSDNIPISTSLAPSPKATSRTISTLTFEANVPEDIDFEDIHSDSNMLESISTTHSQAVFNSQKREFSEEVMPIDDQLAGVTKRDIIPMDVDIVEVDSDTIMTNEAINNNDYEETSSTGVQKSANTTDDSNMEMTIEEAAEIDVLQAEKVDSVSPQRATANEPTTSTAQISLTTTVVANSSIPEKAYITNYADSEEQQTDRTPFSESESTQPAVNEEPRSAAATPQKESISTTDMNIPKEKASKSRVKKAEVAASQPPLPASPTTKRNLRSTTKAISEAATAETESPNTTPTHPSHENRSGKLRSRERSKTITTATVTSPRRVTRSQKNLMDLSPTTRSGTVRRRDPSPDLALIEKKRSSRSKSNKKSPAKSKKNEEEKSVNVEDQDKETVAMEVVEKEVDEKELAVSPEVSGDEMLKHQDDKQENIQNEAESTPDVESNREEEAVNDNQDEKEPIDEELKRLQEERMQKHKEEIDKILAKFPNLSSYYELIERAGRGKPYLFIPFILCPSLPTKLLHI